MKKYTISLFGHRLVFKKVLVEEMLYNNLKERLKDVSVRVLIGTHGDFDLIALRVCRRLKYDEGYDIDISLIYTSYARVKNDLSYDTGGWYYKDIETMIYELEGVHYKRQIIASNQKMVDDSDEVIVYYTGVRQFNKNNGTKRILEYAKAQNKPVLNIIDTI